MSVDLLMLGSGYAGTAIARRARSEGLSVRVTVRSPERAEALRQQGFDVLASAQLDATIATCVGADTHVVIGFPPDGETDARIAPALQAARAITYISSTGVYGERSGRIDSHTPTSASLSDKHQRILAAEAAYRAYGGTVLRCPGIYGPTRGLHARILRGDHRIPGDGSRVLSRIHIEDIASFALAAVHTRGETFVIGDAEPAPHIEVVRWVCTTYGVPVPPAIPWEQVHESLRADRAVDASEPRARLGVTLRYPSYREGMAPTATGLVP